MSRVTYIEDFATWQKEFEFYEEIKVRFSETDMFGHVNNTVLFVYFEQARLEYFRKKGFMELWGNRENDLISVIADIQCDFLAQIYYDETLKVYVKTASLGTSSADLHYMVEKDDGTICSTGRGTIVQISRSTGKSVPWTEEMRKAFLNEKLIF